MLAFFRSRSLDPAIVILVSLLLIFGLVMLISASGPVAFQRTGDSLFYVKGQLLKGVLPGMIAFFLFAWIDYRTWRAYAGAALVASIILLVLVYIPGIGLKLGGARGWVHLFGVQFQPSELVKFTFLIYLSAWLAARKAGEAHSIEQGLIPFVLALGSVMLLLLLQPDTGSMMIIVGTSLLLYFLSGAPYTWFLGLSVVGSGLIAALVKWSPYRAARFMVFLHPELDPKGIGYHINQAALAIGSGGWFGVGFGHSRQKFLYLPEVESDSIIAVIAEEMGFLFICLLVFLFAGLVWRCFRIARECRDPFGAYLAVGVGGMIGLQVLLNMGSMNGLLPMTGVTLPFISYGGSSMTVLLAALGLVAGIPGRQTHRV
jgi:cell division protein FtsW